MAPGSMMGKFCINHWENIVGQSCLDAQTLLFDFFGTTCEMPTRPGVRVNNRFYSTRRTARPRNPAVCGWFHTKLSLVLQKNIPRWLRLTFVMRKSQTINNNEFKPMKSVRVESNLESSNTHNNTSQYICSQLTPYLLRSTLSLRFW